MLPVNDIRCPVAGCSARKGQEQLTCKRCWFKVPKLIRDRIWELYRRRGGDNRWPEADRAEHRRVCLETIAALSKAAEHRARKAALGG